MTKSRVTPDAAIVELTSATETDPAQAKKQRKPRQPKTTKSAKVTEPLKEASIATVDVVVEPEVAVQPPVPLEPT